MGVRALGLAAQVLLGERRALVGRLRLAPDQQDRALGPALAQLGGAVGRGQAAADQQELDSRGRPLAAVARRAVAVRRARRSP